MLLTACIVAALAVIQSLFGVRLLVFGTPTLLLLGYPFADTLAILLPASITISLLQIGHSRGQDVAFVKSFAVLSLVPLMAMLAMALLLDLHASLNLVVAVMLAVFVTLRFFPALRARARVWVLRHDIRALIAFCYACFAAVQLAVLAFVTPAALGWPMLGYGTVAAGVFLVIGQPVFRWAPAPAFDWLLTLMAGAYAGLMGLRAAGVL